MGIKCDTSPTVLKDCVNALPKNPDSVAVANEALEDRKDSNFRGSDGSLSFSTVMVDSCKTLDGSVHYQDFVIPQSVNKGASPVGSWYENGDCALKNSGSRNAFTSTWSMRVSDVEDLTDETDERRDFETKCDEEVLEDSGDDGDCSPPPYRSQNASEDCSGSYSGGQNQVTEDNGANRESMYPNSFYSDQGSEPTGVGAGLSNLGNTCFMNAILQCVTHTVPLVEALRTCSRRRACNNEGFCAHCALLNHIEHSLASSGKTVAPMCFFRNLQNISNYFQRGYQEDAHEFLLALFDKLGSCFESSISKNDNVVDRVFGGLLLSRITCSSCGNCFDAYEPLNSFSLGIEGVTTLQSALDSFTKVERIEDSTCEKCKKQVLRIKRLIIEKAPIVVAFQLKRFKFGYYSAEKIGYHVGFPMELDLSPYTNSSQEKADLKYQLYATVVHDGTSPISGHYYSYIRSSRETWHEMNDSLVIKCSEETVLSQPAYILFYARENTPWPSSFFESNNPCLDTSESNYSPKSVLDGIDGESALHTDMVNLDNPEKNIAGNVAEEMQMVSEVTYFINDTSNTYEEKQNEDDMCKVESEDDTVMVEAAVASTLSSGDKDMQHDKPSLEQSVCGMEVVRIGINEPQLQQRVEQSVCNMETMSIGTNESQLQTACKFSSPKTRLHRTHNPLKAENRVNCKKASKFPKEAQRMEAIRYLGKGMSNARSSCLLAALNSSKGKKRSLSPPFKKSRPPVPGR